MTIRTSKQTVTFRQPFSLRGFNEVLPAGDYCVEVDEERLEGVSFPAYRRISAVIQLPDKFGRTSFPRSLTIDPNELDAALQRDQAAAAPADRQAPADGQAGEQGESDTTIARSD